MPVVPAWLDVEVDDRATDDVSNCHDPGRKVRAVEFRSIDLCGRTKMQVRMRWKGWYAGMPMPGYDLGAAALPNGVHVRNDPGIPCKSGWRFRIVNELVSKIDGQRESRVSIHVDGATVDERQRVRLRRRMIAVADNEDAVGHD